MKSLLLYLVRKRNPHFIIDPSVDGRILVGFFLTNIFRMTRGLKLLVRGRNPRGMMLGSGVTFMYSHRIKWGRFLKAGKHVTFSGLGKHGLVLGDNVSIGDFSSVIVSTTLQDTGHGITIGNNVGIGEFAYLGGAGGLTIGDDCIIGQYLSCHPENHYYADPDLLIRHQGVNRKGIKIGCNCWIGSKVTILDGVSIGDGCVIAAGAVVTKSFPENTVIGGIPAREIGSGRTKKEVLKQIKTIPVS